ncbi:Eukaryotic translation initiation factor 2, partial [Schistosoma japonicum]
RFAYDPTRRVKVKSDERKRRSRSAESLSDNIHKDFVRSCNTESDKGLRHEYPSDINPHDTMSIQEQPYASMETFKPAYI